MATRLTENQRAEPFQCGSCAFFRRRDYAGDTLGLCTIRLPQWVQAIPQPRECDSLVNNRTMGDQCGCDLWKVRTEGGKQVVFERTVTWLAGSPS